MLNNGWSLPDKTKSELFIEGDGRVARKTIRASDRMSRAALQLTRSCDISALVILTII